MSVKRLEANKTTKRERGRRIKEKESRKGNDETVKICNTYN